MIAIEDEVGPQILVMLRRGMTRHQVRDYLKVVTAQFKELEKNESEWNRTTVGCVFDGWNGDPRELHDIPEARRLAQFAIDGGIMPLLDGSFRIPEFWTPSAKRCAAQGIHPMQLFGMGAVEMYCLARDYTSMEAGAIRAEVVRNVLLLMMKK